MRSPPSLFQKKTPRPKKIIYGLTEIMCLVYILFRGSFSFFFLSSSFFISPKKRACDGIFDVMKSEDVLDFVRAKLEDGESAEETAKALTQACLTKGSTDNMSVVVVVLDAANLKKGSQVRSQPRSVATVDAQPFGFNGRTDSQRRLDGDYFDDSEDDVDAAEPEVAPPMELAYTRVDTVGSGFMTLEARLESIQTQLDAIKERTAKQAAKWL